MGPVFLFLLFSFSIGFGMNVLFWGRPKRMNGLPNVVFLLFVTFLYRSWVFGSVKWEHFVFISGVV